MAQCFECAPALKREARNDCALLRQLDDHCLLRPVDEELGEPAVSKAAYGYRPSAPFVLEIDELGFAASGLFCSPPSFPRFSVGWRGGSRIIRRGMSPLSLLDKCRPINIRGRADN
jgi:hypothetical protein